MLKVWNETQADLWETMQALMVLRAGGGHGVGGLLPVCRDDLVKQQQWLLFIGGFATEAGRGGVQDALTSFHFCVLVQSLNTLWIIDPFVQAKVI